jgi:outer membrane receptor protein involved in Fe transport
LPAVTASILLRSNLQLRAAWSQTVVRPTYREISEAEIYDVALGRTILGNTGLVMSAAVNYDARLEWYPRPGELVSFGVFMKKIENAIEQSAKDTSNEQVFYDNYDEADVFGFELELRKEFRGFLGPGADQFSLGFNYAYIKSLVDLTGVQITNRMNNYGGRETDRPMYDQPEYVINGDLTWDNYLTGTSITLNGGVTGRRLVLVGLASPDEYEEPAPYLDFSISQRLGRRWRAKFSAKNLLNPSYEVTQTWPSIGTVPIKSYKKGMSFGFSLAWDF